MIEVRPKRLERKVSLYLGLAPGTAARGLFRSRFNSKERGTLPTVYSKPSCVQCDMTKREMKKKSIEYREVNVIEDESALAKIKELGYLQAPVVLLEDGTHWSGFRPDMIAQHLA